MLCKQYILPSHGFSGRRIVFRPESHRVFQADSFQRGKPFEANKTAFLLLRLKRLLPAAL